MFANTEGFLQCLPNFQKRSQQHQQGLICINPRPKAHIRESQRVCLTRSAPVELTLERILSLRNLPIPIAAGSVGVSVTAFKRACRHLGIRRWAFKRGKGKQKSAAEEQFMTPPAIAVALTTQKSENVDPCGTRLKDEISTESGWKQAEWEGLADGCRALAEDWLRRVSVVSSSACSWSESFPTEPTVEADNRLVLDILAQGWL